MRPRSTIIFSIAFVILSLAALVFLKTFIGNSLGINSSKAGSNEYVVLRPIFGGTSGNLKTGDIVQMGIMTGPVNNGVLSTSLTVKFDTNVLTAQKLVPGNLPVSSSNIDSNTGTITFSLASPNSPIYQDFLLGTIYFQIKDANKLPTTLNMVQTTASQKGTQTNLATSYAIDTKPACQKIGINYATYSLNHDYSNTNARAQRYGMGYMLLIGKFAGEQYGMKDDFNDALDRGITPILRICDSNSCPAYANPADYVNMIQSLSDLVIGRTFYIIAGPNEPLAEMWEYNIDANNNLNPNGSTTDFNLVAQKTTDYMNAVITGVKALNRPNIKLLSPAFNTTEAKFYQLVSQMKADGAKFDQLDGIAGNAYNLGNNQNISDWVARMKSAGFSGSNLFLTETGVNPFAGTPSLTDIQGLINQLSNLKADANVKAYLLFNSFGTNTDSRFAYNVFSQDTFTNILRQAGCVNLCPSFAQPRCSIGQGIIFASPNPISGCLGAPSCSSSPLPTSAPHPSSGPAGGIIRSIFRLPTIRR